MQGAMQAQVDSLAIDSLRKQASRVLQTSDSLRRAWDVQWKKSDSLRIESMFLRMRSDSLQRAAQAILATIARLENVVPDTLNSTRAPVIFDNASNRKVEVAAKTVRSAKVATGKTVSDSLTAHVMRFKPDTGAASFYAEQFHGRKTASGEVFNMNERTCAHRWLPFNTLVKVTNLANGKSVVVRVTDRGPWKHARIIDLSKQAAKELDMIRAGVARVTIEAAPRPTEPD